MAKNEKQYLPQINISGAHIIYRNFAGAPSIDPKTKRNYNVNGARYFSITLDPEMAKDFEARGINVKYPKTADGEIDKERSPYVQVKVSGTQEVNAWTELYIVDENDKAVRIDNTQQSQFEMLDRMWYDNERGSDLVLRQYEWTSPTGGSGISLYLAIGYFRKTKDQMQIENPFAAKFN